MGIRIRLIRPKINCLLLQDLRANQDLRPETRKKIGINHISSHPINRWATMLSLSSFKCHFPPPKNRAQWKKNTDIITTVRNQSMSYLRSFMIFSIHMAVYLSTINKPSSGYRPTYVLSNFLVSSRMTKKTISPPAENNYKWTCDLLRF